MDVKLGDTSYKDGIAGTVIGRAQRSAATVFVIRGCGAGVAYATQILLARLMEREAYGIYATTWVWILVLSHLTLFGQAQLVCRYIPFYRVRNEVKLVRGIILGGALTTLSVAAVAATGSALLLWVAEPFVGPAYLLPFTLALVVLPLVAIQDYLEALARSFNWMFLAMGPPFVLRPALITIAMLTAACLAIPPLASVAVTATLLATLGTTVLQGTLLLRWLGTSWATVHGNTASESGYWRLCR